MAFTRDEGKALRYIGARDALTVIEDIQSSAVGGGFFAAGEIVGGGPEDPAADFLGVVGFAGGVSLARSIDDELNRRYFYPVIDKIP